MQPYYFWLRAMKLMYKLLQRNEMNRKKIILMIVKREGVRKIVVKYDLL